MLKLLRVENFALIDHLELEFAPGLNLLTGETGSGKSIIIDALGLVLGDRAATDMIRTGAKNASIEALFKIPIGNNFEHIISNYGLNNNNDEVIIRREVAPLGKSRVFINNSMATLQTLKELGTRMVSLQGQGDQQALQSAESQQRLLDQYGGNAERIREIADLFEALANTVRKRQSLQMSEQERLQRIDQLRFQTEEVERLKPRVDEEQELLHDKIRLSNIEELSRLAGTCFDELYEREDALVARLGRSIGLMEELSGIDPGAKPYFEQLGNLRYTLEDVSYFLRDYLQNLDYEPEKLEAIEARLSSLDRLKRKHGGSLETVLNRHTEMKAELESLESYADNLEQIDRQWELLKERYVALARSLTEKRRGDALRLQEHLADELRHLGMGQVRFKVAVDSAVADEGGDLKGMTRHGWDRIEFLVAVNPGEDLKSLSKTASGGELSRIYLALGTAMRAEWSGKTLIFDEVDAGIGGGTAELVGKKLKDLSAKNQVICVTHLPQIASFADHHYHIYKKAQKGRTTTHLELLEGRRRVQEIARMLGGRRITKTTTEHAQEMLDNRQTQ